MSKLTSNLNIDKSVINEASFKAILEIMREEQEAIHQGGGVIAIERQHGKGRLTARERIQHLIDPNSIFFELGISECGIGASLIDSTIRSANRCCLGASNWNDENRVLLGWHLEIPGHSAGLGPRGSQRPPHGSRLPDESNG